MKPTNLQMVLTLAAALILGGVLIAQTLTPVGQIKPTTGPATAVVVTVSTKAMWADLGPGLAVDVLPTGRAMIRAIATGGHTHVTGFAPTLTWEDPRTCFTLPTGAQSPVVLLNGLRESVVEDYTEANGKVCFIPYYGNLLVNTPDGGKQLVRVDYVTTP